MWRIKLHPETTTVIKQNDNRIWKKQNKTQNVIQFGALKHKCHKVHIHIHQKQTLRKCKNHNDIVTHSLEWLTVENINNTEC